MCALSTLLTQGNSGANSSLHFAELAQLVERRLAKAKVAGSNPVFRSNKPGFHALGGSGLFHGRRLSWRRHRFTTVARSSGASRRTGPLADRSDAIPGSLEQGWNICPLGLVR